MISVQKRFLFVHVPKTGGNSVQEVLGRYSEDEMIRLDGRHDGVERFGVRNTEASDLKKHSPLRQYQRELAPALFKSLFKFSIIRNPWDRMVSWYFSPGSGRTEWDRDAFIQLAREKPPLEKYITIASFGEQLASKLGIRRAIVPLDRDLNFLIRFEQLNDDFQRLCRLIDIPLTSLRQRNKSDRRHYSHYYDEDTRALVADRFRSEITHGGYEFSRRD